MPLSRTPFSAWLMPFSLIFGLLMGARIGAEMEIWTQLACREVERHPITGGPIGPIGMAYETIPAPQFEMSPLDPFRKVEAADKEWAQKCRQSSKVTQKTTKYLTTVVTFSGIIGAATAGFCILTYPETFAFRSALVASVLGSLFVGPDAANAITRAYVSDATEAGTRATIFGVFSGLGLAGIAAGPMLGALLLRLSGGMILLPYYLDFGMRIIFLLAMTFIIPESLPVELRSGRHQPTEDDAHADELVRNRRLGDFARRIIAKAVEGFKLAMSPLTVLIPRPISEESDPEHPLALSYADVVGRSSRRDWNVTNVAASYATFALISGIVMVKMLFVRYEFNWGPEEVNAFISFLSTTTLSVLLFGIPLVVKRMRKAPPLPSRARPADGTPDLQMQWDEDALRLKMISDARFDLSLTRTSMIIASLSYAIAGIPSKRPTMFLVGTGLLALSDGAAPALQSLALSLVSPRDSGRMLASLSVLNSVVLVISQPLFGTLYVYSVEIFPQLVFFVACGLFVVALLPAMAVRLPRGKVDREAE
ncbi:hypothetical protein RQP46_001106 [Phenoliferia psychrophenolica]